MLKELFIGHKPSHFKPNIFVKAFILSETIFWSSQNLFAPIFAIFITNEIVGGTIELAATSISVYWITRILAEFLSTYFFNKSIDKQKIILVMIGFTITGISELAFAYSSTPLHIFIIYSLIGFGIGFASPQRNSLFSAHIDKKHETTEWGIYDITVFIGIALSTSLGGFIAGVYGFHSLFIISGIFCLLSIIPYLLLYKQAQPK